ncbi:G-patch domain and KOW motifs-containing protein-like [Sycon ciliatum]|uniref:G-patch domain and KOW motifs-containing protein-like n=1 Tax=Sycon ciliatum TaxID=27933 RepID=UPI0031F70D7D
MASSGGGLSFGFSKTSKKSSIVSGPARIDDSQRSRRRDGSEDEDGVVTHVGNTDLAEARSRGDRPKEYVIPLIKSTKRQATGDHGAGSKKKQSEMSELERQAVDELARDAQEAVDGDVDPDRVVPLLMQNRLDKVDESELGEVSKLDDYEDMPVGAFGEAMLRGMGWKPGIGVGKTNKKEVKPVEFIARSGGRGLGAESSKEVQELSGKPKPRRLRPGEERKTEKQLPVGEDGRVRHTRNVGEELEDKEDLELKVGSYCLVESGRHSGLYGKAISLQLDPARVVVRLAISEQTVDVSQASVITVPRRQYEQSALSVSADQRSHDSRHGGRHSPSDRSSRELKPKSYKESNASRHSPADCSSSQHDKSSKKKKKKEKKKKKHHRDDYRSSSDESTHQHSGKPWLAAQLCVRVIDQRYKKGRYYNSKVIIEDVLSPTLCVCRSDSGTVLENVEQSMLETVVPRESMAPVMVVAGEYRRQLGRLLSRDRNSCEAVVQLYPDFEIAQCTFDEVCEYVGRTEHM